MKPQIGKTKEGQKVTVDPRALIAGHLLIQASSGGGKSWLIRKILEETFGAFPHIVIDVEGELKTLREKFDYIVAGADDADCPANVRTAKLLARRVMELNASCIVDIYELKQFEKPMFVKEFIEALLHAPKELWAPRLVVIDEAHLFAPEGDKKGQVSAAAVCDLMGRGRKRGLGVVLATQRLSKLRKDAAGECRNKMVGFCNLLADRKRAADDLGFIGKDGLEVVRRLDTGQFFAVGPAISKKDVIQVQVGKVHTTHPQPGQGLQAALPPPKDRVKKLLRELKDLPKQAQEEAKNLAEAQARIRELEKSLHSAQNGPGRAPAAPVPNKVPRELIEARNDLGAAHRKLEEYQEANDRARQGYDLILGDCQELEKKVIAFLDEFMHKTKRNCQCGKSQKVVALKSRVLSSAPEYPRYWGARTGRISTTKRNVMNQPKPMPNLELNDKLAVGALGGGALRLVAVLVRCMPAAFTKAQWASLANLSHKSGTFGTYLSKIRSMGLIKEDHGLFRPTEAAIELVGLTPEQTMAPKTNDEVIDMWKRALGGTPAKMVEVVRGAHPEAITRQQLAEAVGISHTSGTFGTYFSKLRANGLVQVQGEYVQASDVLLWEGASA